MPSMKEAKLLRILDLVERDLITVNHELEKLSATIRGLRFRIAELEDELDRRVN